MPRATPGQEPFATRASGAARRRCDRCRLREGATCERPESLKMTLATDRPAGVGPLVLRRIAPDDLPFFTRLHALPKSRSISIPEAPRSPEETPHGCSTLSRANAQLAAGYLAVLRKEDGALIGRCGLMDLVVESTAPEHGIRRGWFGREGHLQGSR